MSQITVLSFNDYRSYLRAVTTRSGAEGTELQVAHRLARSLGYKSRRSIEMVLSGRRLPSSDMISKISMVLRHTDTEHRYFELLVELAKSKKRGKHSPEIVAELSARNASFSVESAS